MRGKVFPAYKRTRRVRITPAHAGKSELLNKAMTIFEGSPPHMRGKVKHLL